LGEIIPGVIEKIVKGKPIKARDGSGYGGLVDTWNSLVGKEIAAHTRIKGFKKRFYTFWSIVRPIFPIF